MTKSVDFTAFGGLELGEYFLKKLFDSPQDLVTSISQEIEKELGEKSPLSDQELLVIMYAAALISSMATMSRPPEEFLIATKKVHDYLNGSQYFHNIDQLLVNIVKKNPVGILTAAENIIDQMKSIFETKLAPAVSRRVLMSAFLSFSE